MKRTRRCLTAIVSLTLCIALFLSPTVSAGKTSVAFDLDGSAHFNELDVLYFLRSMYFPNYYATDDNLDYNSDGKVDDSDAKYLLFNYFFPTIYKIENRDFSWHQCPEEARAFLENTTYSEDDYSYTNVTQYVPDPVVSTHNRPVAFKVGGEEFYNLVPGVKTEFSVKGVSGTLCPLDSVRWIRSDKATNVRDIGGWECDGGTVKYGLLYRGSDITPKDIKVLKTELGIKWELNLMEKDDPRTVSTLGEDIGYYKPDVFTQYTLNNRNMYSSLKFVFDAVEKGEPVYIHCKAGADRTGTMMFVLEHLLGMNPGDVDKDYELTMFYSNSLQRTRCNSSFYLKLVNQLKVYEGETFRDKMVTYVKSLGITAEEINAFRAAMTDGNPEIIE